MTRFRHISDPNTSAAPPYELTSGTGADGACADAAAAFVPASPSIQNIGTPETTQCHESRKKKITHCSESNEMATINTSVKAAPQVSTSTSRKRKPPSYAGSYYGDNSNDDAGSSQMLPDKKQNHSEIEKRRRDKMNTYITELSSMIPMCGAMSRKLDKLTVLRMAVQHLRSVRGALSACPLSVRPRPAFLSDKEVNALILQAAHDSFLLVVGCDRGRLLYVSTSVKGMLQYDQSELLGQSLFDILHPKDVAKVKEQLSSSDLSPRERLIDAKTMLPVKTDAVTGTSRLCPGARRSFFCRIKCKAPVDESTDSASMAVKEDNDSVGKLRKNYEKKYCVVQCTGYLKQWAPAEIAGGAPNAEGGEDGDTCNMSCLVAVGRALPDLVPPAPPTPVNQTALTTRRLQYVSRHATDGKFLFVDQRVTLALGFLPQELLGTSLYEYVNGPELAAVARTHKAALLRQETLHSLPYSFRRKDGSYARMETYFKPFKNPWTKDVEYLIAKNTVLDGDQKVDTDVQPACDIYKQTTCMSTCDVATKISETDMEMQRLIDSQVESHKIGSAIADEVQSRSSPDFSADLSIDLLQDNIFNQQASLADNMLSFDPTHTQVRNNVPLSAAGAESSPPLETPSLSTDPPPPASPPLPDLGLDGNDIEDILQQALLHL